jgi:hypothetical protein
MSYTETQTYVGLLMLEQSCRGTVIFHEGTYRMVYYPHYVDQLVQRDLGECVIGWEQLTDWETAEHYDIWSPTVYTVEQIMGRYDGLVSAIQAARLAAGIRS